MNKSFGILYILFNLKTNDCGLMYELINSIKSVKHFHPDINIIIYVEKHPDYDKSNIIPDEIKEYVKIITFSNHYNNTVNREDYWMGFNGEGGAMGINEILCYLDSPFEYTLYLDCDTRILNKLDYLINDCSEDLYFTHDNWWKIKDNKLQNTAKHQNCINGGLMLYKKTENTKLFLNRVIQLINTTDYCVQNAFTKIIIDTNHKVEYLDNRYYNFRCENKRDLPDTDDVIICHSHGFLINKY